MPLPLSVVRIWQGSARLLGGHTELNIWSIPRPARLSLYDSADLCSLSSFTGIGSDIYQLAIEEHLPL